MASSPQQCAQTILEVTPILLQAIRGEMRRISTADMTVPQFRTLSFLDHNPGASLSAVAEFIGLTLSSMSILVNALVERDLVERRTDSDDRRRVCLTVTQTGHEILQSTLQATEERLAEIVSSLRSDERETVVRGMQLLRPLFAPGAATVHNEPDHPGRSGAQ